MKKERKRVVLLTSMILGSSFVAVMITSFFITGTHQHSHPFLCKLLVGAIGPLMVLFTDGGFPSLTFLIGTGVLTLLIIPIVIGIAKCRMVPALLGAIPLALLWLATGCLFCFLTNLS